MTEAEKRLHAIMNDAESVRAKLMRIIEEGVSSRAAHIAKDAIANIDRIIANTSLENTFEQPPES